jgi:hypothetical protein
MGGGLGATLVGVDETTSCVSFAVPLFSSREQAAQRDVAPMTASTHRTDTVTCRPDSKLVTRRP